MKRFSLLFALLLAMTGCPESSSGSLPDVPGVDAPTTDTNGGSDGGGSDAGGSDAGGADISEADAGPGFDGGTDAGPPGIDAGPEPMNHRPEHGPGCDMERDSPMVSPGPFEGCESHEDCTEGANGRCLAGRAGNSCSYDLCFMDSDCTGPCICGAGVGANRCTSGGCQIDSDCGPGGWCSPTFGGCGNFGGVVAYECHTPDDECIDDADCAGTGPGAYCKFSNETSRWICDNAQCAG